MSDEEKEKREEKREAVILFADLMNSSELSNILSAEDYDNILKSFQKELGKVVEEKIKKKREDKIKEWTEKENGEEQQRLQEKIESYKDFKVETGVRGDEVCVNLYNAKIYNAKDGNDKDKNDKELVQKELLQEDIETALQIAIEMKRKWVISGLNRERIDNHKQLSDVGIGVNSGTIVLGKHPRFNENSEIEEEGKPTPEGYAYNGPRNLDRVICYTWERERGGPSGEFEEAASAVV